MSRQSTATDSAARSTDESNLNETLPITTTPTVKPLLIWMGITTLAALAAVGVVSMNPGTFGGPRPAGILSQVILAIAVLVLIRFAIRVFILKRTEYRIEPNRIKRQYALLLRTHDREVPIEKIRSSQLQQGRIQNLMGYGTIDVNQGLGDLRLENIEDPHTVRNTISTLVSTQTTNES